ncbi:MAG: PAS domain-containing protein, partial [Candidatus Sericytochromatia bacterium]
MPPRKAASFSPALKALCMHHELPACYMEAGERPVLANPVFESQAERLIGAPWQAIARHPHALLAARARPAMNHGRPAFDCGGWVTPTGEHWDLHALPFLDETGRCLGVVLYFQPPAPLGERGRLAEA